MAKMWNYVFITVGLMILFYVAGLNENQGTVLGIYNMTSPGQLSNIKNIEFFDKLNTTGWITLFGTGAAIVIGLYYSRTSAYQALSAGLAISILVFFIADLVSIQNQLGSGDSWIGWLGFIILLPFTFGYVLSIWEWVGGRD